MAIIVLLLSVLFFLQSCSYAISSAMVDTVDKTITFEMLQIDPDSYEGSLVIFGGTINKTTYLPQGTLIDVFQKPLDYWGKPIRTSRTAGRFLVYSPEYLGFDSFAPGRDITIAGEVAGNRLKKIGGMEFTEFTEYSYPVLNAKEIKIWPVTRSSEQPEDWWDPLSGGYAPPEHQ